MERILYLSSIDEAFDPVKDVALGPWCFAVNEDLIPNWDGNDFSDPFEDSSRLAATVSALDDLTKYWIGELKTRLNERHGVDYGLPYWWAVNSRWLTHLIAFTWRHWAVLEYFVECHPEDTFVVDLFSEETEQDWNFRTTEEFIFNGLRNSVFDWWLYSRIAPMILPRDWPIRTKKPRSLGLRAASDFHTVRGKASRSKAIVEKFLGRSSVQHILGIRAATLPLSLLARVLPKKEPRFFGSTCDKPPDFFPPAFLTALEEIIQIGMPVSVGENFNQYDRAAKRANYFPGRLFVTGAAHSNDQANFEVAQALEQGECVVRYQHGSQMGTMDFGYVMQIVEYSYHGYFSWGWTSQSGWNHKIFPVAAPSLSKIRERHRQLNSQIILVGTRTNVLSNRIDQEPSPTYLPRYRRDKLAFIRALPDRLRSDFLYRPYGRGETGLKDEAFILEHEPDIQICRVNLEAQILRCRLLVLDHPGTTLNIALAANVPTVCFWPEDVWPEAPEAKLYFDGLRRTGIIHSDAEATARFVADIAADVQDWWQSAQVQTARRAWADQFARARRLWWVDWIKAMAQI
jgi:putative transferase (TIGR04331 family)